MWVKYRNGNTDVLFDLKNGTKIRQTEDDEFKPVFAENMDVKITNVCNRQCRMCHEGSSPNGKHSDIMNQKWVDTLHPYQEIALGGGNVLEFPDLEPLLYKLKRLKVIANFTVNQKHFMENFDYIKSLYDKGLVHGIGVSLTDPTDEFIEKVKQIPTVVIHTIAGITPIEQYVELMEHFNLKVLILGYKDLRRGHDLMSDPKTANLIASCQADLFRSLHFNDGIRTWKESFSTVSFDNLALEQLRIKDLIDQAEWERLYQGDEGSQTFYVDAVEGVFGESSVAPMDERYPILDNVDEMFKKIRGAK